MSEYIQLNYKKGAGRRIAKIISEIRKQPLSDKLLKIIDEISEVEKKRLKKVARQNNVGV